MSSLPATRNGKTWLGLRAAAAFSGPSTHAIDFGRRLMALSSPTLMQGACLRTTADIRNFYAQGGGQINLMILLLHDDLANLLGHRVFAKRLTLPNSVAVIANGFIFILEIIAEHEHKFRIVSAAYGKHSRQP